MYVKLARDVHKTFLRVIHVLRTGNALVINSYLIGSSFFLRGKFSFHNIAI